MSDSRSRGGLDRSLPVIMPTVSSQRWSCHSCGRCCYELVGHLFQADRERIDKQNWVERLDVPPYVRAARGWALNKRVDGACVFLDEAGLCKIHAEYGEAAKPLACRVFPFSLRRTRHGWQVSLRFDCPSVTSSKGKPIGQHRAWLQGLADQLGKSEQEPDGGDSVDLQRGIEATVEEVDAVVSRFTRWISRENLSLGQRLIGAARITTTLSRATLTKVRGSRFVELLDLLFASLPGESAVAPVPPTVRQRGMLRQLAFAHVEHVSLTELRSGVPSRIRKRWGQLRRSRRFRTGCGAVPLWGDATRTVTFDTVERIEVSTEHAGEIEDLLVRYLTSRLHSRSVFGQGYYGFAVFDGLASLWLAIAAAGWLARCATAVDGRTIATFEDIAKGIGLVDRAATRLPALGTMAERARLRYLLNEDGIARVGSAYGLLPALSSD